MFICTQEETKIIFLLVTKGCVCFHQILNSYVVFEVYDGVNQVANLKMTQSRMNDGEWHHLLIELKSTKDGKDIKYLAVVSLDYGMYQVGDIHNF